MLWKKVKHFLAWFYNLCILLSCYSSNGTSWPDLTCFFDSTICGYFLRKMSEGTSFSYYAPGQYKMQWMLLFLSETHLLPHTWPFSPIACPLTWHIGTENYDELILDLFVDESKLAYSFILHWIFILHWSNENGFFTLVLNVWSNCCILCLCYIFHSIFCSALHVFEDSSPSAWIAFAGFGNHYWWEVLSDIECDNGLYK